MQPLYSAGMAQVSPPNGPPPARGQGGLLRGAARLGWARALILNPVSRWVGYGFATVSGIVWGGILSRFRLRREGGMIVAPHLPTWAFGRGGTTIGGVYLTRDNVSADILEHEAIHKAQWKKYGLAFIPLYVEAGQSARTNRFEVEAGLKKGGYTK